MTTKFERLMACEKGSPPTMVIWQSSHVTNENRFRSIFTWLLDTKLEKVMAYGIWSSRTKSHDIWSRDHMYSHDKKTHNISNSQFHNVNLKLHTTQNLTEWWLMTWDHHSKNHIIVSKVSFSFIIFFFPVM